LVTTRDLYTVVSHHDGVLPYLTLCTAVRRARVNARPDDGSNLDAHHNRSISIVGAHAVEFSKTAKPHRKWFLLEETDLALRPKTPSGRTTDYSAIEPRWLVELPVGPAGTARRCGEGSGEVMLFVLK